MQPSCLVDLLTLMMFAGKVRTEGLTNSSDFSERSHMWLTTRKVLCNQVEKDRELPQEPIDDWTGQTILWSQESIMYQVRQTSGTKFSTPHCNDDQDKLW